MIARPVRIDVGHDASYDVIIPAAAGEKRLYTRARGLASLHEDEAVLVPDDHRSSKDRRLDFGQGFPDGLRGGCRRDASVVSPALER